MAASALAPLTAAQRERLLGAQAEVRRLLAISMVSIEVEDPASADARWCIGHYFAELRERFEEPFDPELTTPADTPDLVPPRGAFLVARLSGQPAGCGAVLTVSPGVGEIKRMWIDRPHRSMGVGSRLLTALEEQALKLGHRTVLLDTNRSLAEAQAMYGARGYVATEPYNDNPYADFWFEKRLR
jgi:GNAT superfamily N-acetyltransferase